MGIRPQPIETAGRIEAPAGPVENHDGAVSIGFAGEIEIRPCRTSGDFAKFPVIFPFIRNCATSLPVFGEGRVGSACVGLVTGVPHPASLCSATLPEDGEGLSTPHTYWPPLMWISAPFT